ncbi:hypothetical protein BCON_0490g00020 [Botryotinia convoluta]|uniref:Zn(2)-C6 fungal-type domain-containing protein n=1 Tax=Botryotinia convoluta TaxID=54673 RepID=A0A4Z1H8U9_9HELO|nr:hypothetical protein BCON_0490g00020 [Botryotinia convoluta]
MSSTPNLRRNGKRPSCEPCRIGKLACGHEQPYCGRCVKRGLEGRCWYHPAPMSRGRVDGEREGNEEGGKESGDGGSVKRRRIGGRVRGGGENAEERVDGNGGRGRGGLDSLANVTVMRDVEREEGGGESIEAPSKTPSHSHNISKSTTPQNNSLGMLTTGVEPQTTKPTNNVYLSSRGCRSATPNCQSHKRSSPNSIDPMPEKPTMQNNWNGASYKRSRRFWGPTSFGAVFRNGDGNGEGKELDAERGSGESDESGRRRETLAGGIGGMLDIGEDGRKNPSSWPFGPPLLGRNRPTSYTIRCEMITKALWNIPSLSSCNKLLERYHDLLELSVLPEFMIKYLISSIYDTFGSILAEPRSKEKFIPFVETLLRNEETPLPSSPDDGIAWLNTFCGSNIRFESMGLLFCFIGRAYQSLVDGNPLFQKEENHGRNRRQTSWRMNECADVMGKMCDCTDTVNEIVVAFWVSIYVLESSVVGDESYSNLNRHGNMVTSACAIGLHRLPHLPPHLLTTAAEYKRRLFASVYTMDKCSSALNGTPPGISRLYCRLQMPSDLSETELFLPRAQMQQAIAACDEQGWNRKGEIYCGTCYRANLQIYMIKEEILEGALGVDVEVSRERIDSLLSRTASLSLNRPPQFQFNPTSTGRLLFVQLIISFEALQNTLLLYRLAVANRLEGNYIQGLLDTAMEMLEKVIMMWEKRDVLVGFEFCFDWFITSYGIPAAGVICVELLKRMSGNSTSASGSETRKMGIQEKTMARFPKSVAIQKLALFGAFLDWVRDTDGNYALLRRVRGVVGRVLKWVLDGGDFDREIEREKEKGNSSQEDPSRMAQSTIDPKQVQTQEITNNIGIENGIRAEGPQVWDNAGVNFLPQPAQTGQTVFDDEFTASLDFNTGLESLDGIGMEEMWGQVDWLNAGDWIGGVGMGGMGNGNTGFGFGF